MYAIITLSEEKNNAMNSHITEFIQEFGLFYDPIHSFTQFVSEDIHRIVRSLVIPGRVVGNARLEAPVAPEGHPLLPNEARLRNLTYAGALTADVENAETGVVVREILAHIPLMIMPEDEEDGIGGFFIVNGSEKVLVNQERWAKSGIIMSVDGAMDVRARVGQVKLIVTADGLINVVLQQKRDTLKKQETIPLVEALRGWGMGTDREIYEALRGAPEQTVMRMLLAAPPPPLSFGNKNPVLARLACRGAVRALRDDLVCSDKDHLGNKTLMTAGALTSQIVKLALHFVRHTIVKKQQSTTQRIAPQKTLGRKTWCRPESPPPPLFGGGVAATRMIAHAFSTGIWGRTHRGISQALSRFNRVAAISHLRRVTSSLNHMCKSAAPRQLHGTHYGFYCPAETPEGESCGLSKNLALTAIISGHTDEQVVMDRVKLGGRYTLVMNGLPGAAVEPEVVEYLRTLRRRREIPFDVTIIEAPMYREVQIKTCAGRLLRPLIVLGLNVVDFLSADEIDYNVRIGVTHEELHGSAIFGPTAATIPFSNHNQAPRNVYYCAMAKQAVAARPLAPRMDTQRHELHYPQRPLVETFATALVGEVEAPAGMNLVVAIFPMFGFNQEDSVVISQSAIDRGLFRSSYIRTCTVAEEENRVTGASDHIDLDNVRAPGETLEVGAALIPVQTACSDGTMCKKDLHVKTACRVDRVAVSAVAGSSTRCKVAFRTERIPQVGDKFCSSHGQKGVCALTLRHEDMPFTRDGLVPDLIINPHCIPSRMTIGHLLEMLQGKVAAVSGSVRDGTPFVHTAESIANDLHALEYQKHGNEVMFCGLTGQRIPCPVFIGPIQYRRLKHQVDDKIHARGRGPVSRLTRQPVDGRVRDGGLRFGEMERDALVAYGAASMINDRLFENSDPHSVVVCNRCGLMDVPCTCGAGGAGEAGGAKTDKRLPYATKLLFQELYAMGIAPRIKRTKMLHE